MARDDAVDLGIAGLGPAIRIGEGGNAVVYRCRQDSLDRNVAVKLLKRAGDEGTQRRFNREQRAMGRMSQHDGIVTVYESGLTDTGQPYLVMPLLPRSLHDELEATGPFPWDQAVEVIAEVADTVEFAHREGLVHRDLKPANLMRSLTGRPLVADFGISRIVDSDASLQSTALTLTPAYSPPESMSGAEPAPTTDVYSLAASLYALIEGHPPFVDSTTSSNLLALIRRVADDPLPPLTADAPPWVDAVLADAMAKDPAERIQTAGELAKRLRAGAGGLAATATKAADESATSNAATHVIYRSSDADEASADAAKRNPWILRSVAALAAVAVLAVVAVVATSGGDKSADPVDDTSVQSTEPVATTESSASVDEPADSAAEPAASNAPAEPAAPAPQSIASQVLLPSSTGMAHVLVEEPVIGFADYASVSDPSRYRPESALGSNVDVYVDVWSTTNAFYREWLIYQAGANPESLDEHIPQAWASPTFDQLSVMAEGTRNDAVTGISLDSARAYCQYVNKRLATEIEWELATTNGLLEPGPVEVQNWVDAPDEYGPVEPGLSVLRGSFGSESLDDYYRTIGMDGDVFRSSAGFRCASDDVREEVAIEVPPDADTIYVDDFSDLDTGWPSRSPDGQFSLGYHPTDVFHIETEQPWTQVAAVTPVAAPETSTITSAVQLRKPEDPDGQFRYGLLARSSDQGYVVLTIRPELDGTDGYLDWCLGESLVPFVPPGERFAVRSTPAGATLCDGALGEGRLSVRSFDNVLDLAFEGSAPIATIDGTELELAPNAVVSVPAGSPGFYIESFDQERLGHVHYDGITVTTG